MRASPWLRLISRTIKNQMVAHQPSPARLQRARSTQGAAITSRRIEQALDRLAEIMIDLGNDGPKCLPIYKRLESELANMASKEGDMIAVRERLKRSKDRTAAQPAG